MRRVSPRLFTQISLLSVAEFCVLPTVSCDGDVEETDEDEVEKFVDRPGTTKRYVVCCIAIDSSAIFWWVGVCVIFAKLFRVKEQPEFLRKASLSRTKPSSLTYTVASSVVCTSPLAVITVVGFFDILMVSPTQQSLWSRLLSICILAS